MFRSKLIILLVAVFFFSNSFSQSEEINLKQSVTVSYQNTSLEAILEDLSTQYGIEFSYNSDLIEKKNGVTYSCKNKSLNRALTELFDLTNLEFTVVGQHLVLKTKSTPEPTRDKKPLRFTISGFVIDAHTKEALIGAAVYNAETGMGALTNNYGFFSITLPIGKYQIEISYLGYAVARRDIDLGSNTIWNANLSPMNSLVEEVVVSSESKEAYVFKSLAGQTTIKPIDIQKEAAVLGETDVLRSLDKLPGISFQGEGSSYFYVRGGNRDQNLILIDEAPVFNPTHMLGLFTPIIPNAVKSADIYKADIPIQFGGRLSSVIDVHTKDGNKQRFSGSASMGTVSTRFSVEGPILKDKSSFFVSYRSSYFQWILKRFIPEISQFRFTDYTTKFNIQLAKKDRLYVTYFHGNDNIFTRENDENTTGITWSNNTVSIRWNHIFADKLFLNTTTYFSNYDYKLYIDQSQDKYWSSIINSTQLKSELTYYSNPQNKIRMGVQIGAYFFTPGKYTGDDIGINNQVSDLNSTELIAYAGNRQQLSPHLLINYGIRITNWQNSGEAYVVEYNNYEPVDIKHYEEGYTYYNKTFAEPRLSITYKTNTYSSVKLSYNRSVQNIHLINNSVSPFNTQEVWLPSGPNIKPQKANIFNLGYLHSWHKRHIDFNADVYHKSLYNQIAYTNHANLALNTYMEGEIRQGDGKAYGMELALAKTAGRFTWQFSYAFTRSVLQVEGINNNRTFKARQDKPVEISASSAYFARPRWLLSANYTITSGIVTTTPTGFYDYRGTQVPIYAEHNNDRLPFYSRFDLGSDFRLNKNTDGPVEHHLIISFYNFFYKRNSAFLYFDKTVDNDGNLRVPSNKLNGTPLVSSHRYIFSIIPSFTYTLNF